MSVITLDGRIKVNYHGYSKHLETIASGVAKIGAAKLWYSKPTKTYYLLVSMEVEIPELTPTDINRVMGVDVGQRYIAVAADTRNKTQFFSGAYVRHKASRYVKARKSLQRKDTRSATKRLRVLLSRQDWESTGRFSAVPDASSDEAKGERLSRYLQLRWTIDAIPNFNVAESSDEAK